MPQIHDIHHKFGCNVSSLNAALSTSLMKALSAPGFSRYPLLRTIRRAAESVHQALSDCAVVSARPEPAAQRSFQERSLR